MTLSSPTNTAPRAVLSPYWIGDCGRFPVFLRPVPEDNPTLHTIRPCALLELVDCLGNKVHRSALKLVYDEHPLIALQILLAHCKSKAWFLAETFTPSIAKRVSLEPQPMALVNGHVRLRILLH